MFEINSLEDLEKLSVEVKWQYFEKLVGWVFEQNNFSVQVNKVFVLSGKRRQFDVIAERFNDIFIIDCKKWKGNRYKSSALKKAIEKHIERCELFPTEKKKIPLIVTLMQEDIQEVNNVKIVPIDKLNVFINDY